MTEQPEQAGRIDLRALAPDQAQQERVVGGVLSRLAGRPQLPAVVSNDVLESVAGFLPFRWVAAAAALIILASAAAISLTRRAAPPPEAVLAAWVDRAHVPTNGELLSAFLGYTP